MYIHIYIYIYIHNLRIVRVACSGTLLAPEHAVAALLSRSSPEGRCMPRNDRKHNTVLWHGQTAVTT